MGLWSDLTAAPPALPTESRFTTYCGILYLAAGVQFLVWPGSVQTLFGDPPFAGHEAALFRVLGMAVAVIGWFYIFGGRTGARQFVAATILDRLVLVPCVLIPLAAAGVFPHVMSTFAVLDPALALVAWYLLARGRN